MEKTQPGALTGWGREACRLLWLQLKAMKEGNSLVLAPPPQVAPNTPPSLSFPTDLPLHRPERLCPESYVAGPHLTHARVVGTRSVAARWALCTWIFTAPGRAPAPSCALHLPPAVLVSAFVTYFVQVFGSLPSRTVQPRNLLGRRRWEQANERQTEP